MQKLESDANEQKAVEQVATPRLTREQIEELRADYAKWGDQWEDELLLCDMALRFREQIIEEALLRIKERVCGDRIPRWEGDAATTASRIVIADICDHALSAAPNNAGEPQQGDFAAAQNEHPDRASGDRGTLELIAEIDALAEKATPGPWQAWRDGNCRIADGTLVGQSQLDPVPRPYEPRWVGYKDPETALRRHHTTMLRDDDADFIAALRNAWPRLRDALKTASSANGNAVAGEAESPDARDARWISVSERLPTHIHSVLMWVVNDGSVVRDSPYAEIGIYNDRRGKWQMNSGDNDIDVEVTHWQPLPKPPVDAALGSPTDDEERK